MTIIITGASRGIGRFLFEHFTQQGHRVIGTYNSTMMDGAVGYYKVDILSTEDVSLFVQNLHIEDEDIVLINCAGISYSAFAHKSDLREWERVIDVNIKGTFHVIHALLPLMRNKGWGRIINFSSIVTQYPTPGVSAYCASKAGLLGLTKSLAVENASKGITVNAINLGYTNAGMGVNDVPNEYAEKMKAQIPTHRFCEPIEIANTIDYIISTPYLTGCAIDLNGGIL